MLHLLPTRLILTSLVTLNLLVVAYLANWFAPSTSSSPDTLKDISGITVTVLDILVFLIATNLWRLLWRIIPSLSSSYFPDINGIWEGKIIFQGNPEHNNSLNAKARIKQNLLSMHIDIYSTTSKSNTLIAYPTIEAGNKRVYYVYHNTPKNPEYPEYPEYKGTSILEVNNESMPTQLIGHYFTIRGTRGRVELKRISQNPNHDFDTT